MTSNWHHIHVDLTLNRLRINVGLQSIGAGLRSDYGRLTADGGQIEFDQHQMKAGLMSDHC